MNDSRMVVAVALILLAVITAQAWFLVDAVRDFVRERRWKRDGFTERELARWEPAVVRAVTSIANRADAARLAGALAVGPTRALHRRRLIFLVAIIAGFGVGLAFDGAFAQDGGIDTVRIAAALAVGASLGAWIGGAACAVTESVSARLDPLASLAVAAGDLRARHRARSSRHTLLRARAEAVVSLDRMLERVSAPTDDVRTHGQQALSDDGRWEAFVENIIDRTASAYRGDYISVDSADRERTRRASVWKKVRATLSLASLAAVIELARQIWSLHGGSGTPA